MSDELKPCPFCGKDGIIRAWDEDETFDAGCVTGNCGSSHETHDDAVAYWNCRPVEDAQAAEIEKLRADRDTLIAENDRLRAFFTHIIAAFENSNTWSDIVNDIVDIAREALALVRK